MHTGLARSHHSELARFIAAMIPGKGVEVGLSLSGINLKEELVLSRRSGKFRRALRCLQALAAGADSSAAFQELPVWSHHLSESHPLEMPAGAFLCPFLDKMDVIAGFFGPDLKNKVRSTD